MSTLKVDAIRHNSATSDAITTASDGTCTARITSINGGSALSHRNVLINGAMTISQRGSTFSHLGSSNTNILTMDRWKIRRSGSNNFDTTITHSTDSPDGFLNSLKITPDATETPTGTMNGLIEQQIEGQSLQHFAYGTSSAKSITASFYAKSGSQNNGHNYTLQLRKYDSSNNTRIVTKAFTVTSSWQRFTMTFPGDTSNDIKNSTDYTGFEFIFQLATGPDDLVAEQPTWTSTFTNWRGVTGNSNFMDNTSNEFYVTGCQLEVGDTATTFEHRSHADELVRCSRYCQVWGRGYCIGNAVGSNDINIGVPLTTPLRDTPSANALSMHRSGNQSASCTFHSAQYVAGTNVVEIRMGNWTGGAAVSDEVAYAVTPVSPATMILSAEI
tara:strand:- start:36 stop:1193 length:1158 start_codon:yes stop_codon:yes gene_type:complete